MWRVGCVGQNKRRKGAGRGGGDEGCSLRGEGWGVEDRRSRVAVWGSRVVGAGCRVHSVGCRMQCVGVGLWVVVCGGDSVGGECRVCEVQDAGCGV